MEHFTVLSQRSKHNEHFFVTLNLTRNTHTHIHMCMGMHWHLCAQRKRANKGGKKELEHIC